MTISAHRLLVRAGPPRRKKHSAPRSPPENIFIWDDLPATTQHLFFGVAQGWWEDVDIKRGAPIPFPKVFDQLDRPSGTEHFTKMAQILAHFGVFKSTALAMKNGWNKPIVNGEFWLNQRTVRVLIVSAGPVD